MFVDKSQQGGVILFVESIRFFGWIINQFRSKEIYFHSIMKCRQKVVVGGLKGQKLTTSGHSIP